MTAPLFRDPVFDGATDPVLVRHHGRDEWWLLYTQRRSSAPGPGVAWVHGSDIGLAVSGDRGDTWTYRGALGAASGLGAAFGAEPNRRDTFWAPEVVHASGEYHMFLTCIEGVPDGWAGRARSIEHLTSPDLWRWTHHGRLPLSSDRVIDACVYPRPDGGWRLWYKDEADGSTTWAADSPDLFTWSVRGRAVGGPGHEGPNVFRLGGSYWMVVDEWRGLGVHRSDDLEAWARQGVILDRPGRRPDDDGLGHHADVVEVSKDEAWIVYFTHPGEVSPGAHEAEEGGQASGRARRSTVQAAPLRVVDGVLVCDRDAPDRLWLP